MFAGKKPTFFGLLALLLEALVLGVVLGVLALLLLGPVRVGVVALLAAGFFARERVIIHSGPCLQPLDQELLASGRPPVPPPSRALKQRPWLLLASVNSGVPFWFRGERPTPTGTTWRSSRFSANSKTRLVVAQRESAHCAITSTTSGGCVVGYG